MLGFIPTAAPAPQPAAAVDLQGGSGDPLEADAFAAALAETLALIEAEAARPAVPAPPAAAARAPIAWPLPVLTHGEFATDGESPALTDLLLEGQGQARAALDETTAPEHADDPDLAGTVPVELMVPVAPPPPAVDLAVPDPELAEPNVGEELTSEATADAASTSVFAPGVTETVPVPAATGADAPGGHTDVPSQARQDVPAAPRETVGTLQPAERRQAPVTSQPAAAPKAAAHAAPAAPEAAGQVNGTGVAAASMAEAAPESAGVAPVAPRAAAPVAQPPHAPIDQAPVRQDPVAAAGPVIPAAIVEVTRPVAPPAAPQADTAPPVPKGADRGDAGAAPAAPIAAGTTGDGAEMSGGEQFSQGQERQSPEFQRLIAALSQFGQAAPEEPARAGAPPAPVPVTPASGVQAPAAAPAVTGAAALPSPGETPDVESLGRLVHAIRINSRPGAWEATVRLKPEHLGDVTIALRVERNAVSAVVNAEAPGVRQWLESQEQAVRNGMAEHGLQLERFIVQRDGQRREAYPQEQEPRRRQPRQQPQTTERFEIIV